MIIDGSDVSEQYALVYGVPGVLHGLQGLLVSFKGFGIVAGNLYCIQSCNIVDHCAEEIVPLFFGYGYYPVQVCSEGVETFGKNECLRCVGSGIKHQLFFFRREKCPVEYRCGVSYHAVPHASFGKIVPDGDIEGHIVRRFFQRGQCFQKFVLSGKTVVDVLAFVLAAA